MDVGTRTFDGVWFVAYVDDHVPPHVHGFYAGIEVIVEIVGGQVRRANRRDAVRPSNAKQSDVKKVLRTAAAYAVELEELWRVSRG